MDQLTTDGIIERLKGLKDANWATAPRRIQALIDDIINTRNRTAFTLPLLKAHKALQEFGRCTMLPDLADALAAIEGLLNAEAFLGPASPKASPKAPIGYATVNGPAALRVAGKPDEKPRVNYPWECSPATNDCNIMHALSILERESAIHPNKAAVEKHTRFEVNYNMLAAGNIFYVDVPNAYSRRFEDMVNRLPRHSAKVFKVEASPTSRCRQAAEQLERMVESEASYDQLIQTYKAIFAGYLEGEFGELMRGSGRTPEHAKRAWQAAVSRLRGHLGVSDDMVSDIIDGVKGFQAFQERLANAEGRMNPITILKTQEKVKLLWDEALRGPDGEEVAIRFELGPLVKVNADGSAVRVGPAYQQPIEPGRSGDMLCAGPCGVMWRSPGSDGRIDPTIFGATKPIRI